MKPHEKFFKQEIERMARRKEQAIGDYFEGDREAIIGRFYEEIKAGKALLITESFDDLHNWSRTPPVGECFSFADGSRVNSLLDQVDEERKLTLRALREEVTRINRAIMLGDLDKPRLARMLEEFETFDALSGVIER